MHLILCIVFFYSLICASRRVLLLEVGKNPANKILATLACLLTCVSFAHVL